MTPVQSFKTGLISGSMLIGNTVYDSWPDIAAAGNAGFMLTNGTGNTWVSCFNHATTGSWTPFGDLTATGMVGNGHNHNGGGANATRWLMMGGYKSSTGAEDTPIWYATVATKSNGSSFGALGTARFAGAQMGNSTMAMAYAGYLTANIQTVQYATLGNSSNFGSARQPHYNNGSSNSTTRAVSWGGQYGAQETTVDYVEFATTGNYNSFGTIAASNNHNGGGSNTRGIDIAAVSGNSSNLINYITIATTGSVTGYGSLTVARWQAETSAKATSYLVVFGGNAISGGAKTTTVDQFLISSTGNATSWGTLVTATSNSSGNQPGGQNSNCHGGL